MKKISTSIVAMFIATVMMAQLNPGFYEIRLIDCDVNNPCFNAFAQPSGDVQLQMRAIQSDPRTPPTMSNSLTDLIFGVVFTDPSVVDIELDCAVPVGPDCFGNNTDYTIDVSSPTPLTSSTGDVYMPFGAVSTPLLFPTDWVLNQWETIAILDLITTTPPAPNAGSSSSSSSATLVALTPFGFDEMDTDNTAQTGPNIGIDFINYTPAIDQVVPLKLLSFEATKLGERSTHLVWTTADEVNTSHFEIERSQDAQNWEIIGQVGAAGESQQVIQYSYDDLDVFDGRRPNARYYYRLRMADRDGRSTQSNVDVVRFSSDAQLDGADFYVYPNPSTDGLNVEFDVNGDAAQAEEMTLINALGQVVFSGVVPADSEIEYIDYSKMNIGPGTYVLRVTDTEDVIIGQVKVIVQDR